ncbi:MAG: TolC family protein [Sulfuricurvum sp.]|uniref:TolC family protein n=1 Tax=Sulfuricurvum sp. TaxID=2025608 RepID=UPI002633306D|nr:TolC family protein [Sulfuricurvum sp.]MDD2368422.1 TolC family protein [Sulfuricurvum sp.]MDD2950664.1 TolC family protein [Sulfuricurvum sp.]MDD5119148.1 TolC family protein [Sulfuricurvum sp.]
MRKALFSLALLSTGLMAQNLSLDDAIRIALENNRNLKISHTALQIADAQYHQALSARYPQLTASVNVSRMDQDPSFVMKGSFALPQDLSNTFASLTAAASGDPAVIAQTNYAIANNLIPAQSIPIDMDVKLMGRDTAVGRLDLIYPLYTGGKIDAIIKQATLNKSIQSEEARRSEAEVIYDVKRYYYGAMLAKQLSAETHDTLERMNMVKDLTETFYQGGSLKVKKTDYLRTLTTVNMIASMDEEMKSNAELAKSALINATGLPWNTTVELTQNEFPTPQLNGDLKTLVDDAYKFNPTYAQLKLAIDVQSAKVDEASSAYLPSIALTANAQHLANSYDAGLVNDTNKNSWTIGVGLQWNLFEGFRTDYAVQEAKLNKLNFQHKEVLLQEGLALQVKYAFIKLGQSERQNVALTNAKTSAAENADLNTRAYQEDMVETKDVIEAQIMETFAKAAYWKNLHDFAASKAQLDYIIASQSTQVK